jgi:outer membrane protein assembly factor BamD
MSKHTFSYPLLSLILLLFISACASKAKAPPQAVVSQSAESYFQAGEEFYAVKKYPEAIAQWKKVKESSYTPELTSLAELKIADALYEDEKYIEAAADYENFRKIHPNHESDAYALYRLALCNFQQIGTIDVDQTPLKNAIVYYETFLRQYPTSPYAVKVRDDLDVCRVKQVQYEIYVGRFYFRTEKYQAAIKRLEATLAKTPKSPVNDEALFYLAEAYTLYGNMIKGKEAFDRFAREYPNSRFTAEANKFKKKYY